MRIAFAFTAILAAACPCAAQQHPPQTITPTVVAGKQTRVGFQVALNPDCTSRGEIVSRILKNPGHGTLEVVEGLAFPQFPERNPYSRCNQQKVPAMLVMYKSEEGYSGKDAFEVEFIGPLGGDFFHKYYVTVK
jgi:hypothetical protein